MASVRTRLYNLVEHQARAMQQAGRVANKYNWGPKPNKPRDHGVRRRMDKLFAEPPRAWILVDAYGEVMGRLASRLVPLLTGKHKPTYRREADNGDYVVVVNASKVVLTGRAMDCKKYYHHTQYPGGLRTQTVAQLFEQNPVEPLRRAIFGMMPKNLLRHQRMNRLRMYPGPEHAQHAMFNGSDLAFRAVFPEDEGPARLERIRSVAESE